MVHILRQKVGDEVQYLLVGNSPTVRNLKTIGFEYMGKLGGFQETGRYTSTELLKMLESRQRGMDKQIKLAKNRVKILEESKVEIKKFIESHLQNP